MVEILTESQARSSPSGPSLSTLTTVWGALTIAPRPRFHFHLLLFCMEHTLTPPKGCPGSSGTTWRAEGAEEEDALGHSTAHCPGPACRGFSSHRHAFLTSDGITVAACHPFSQAFPPNSKAKPNLLQKMKPESVWHSLSPWVKADGLDPGVAGPPALAESRWPPARLSLLAQDEN